MRTPENAKVARDCIDAEMESDGLTEKDLQMLETYLSEINLVAKPESFKRRTEPTL